MTCGKEQGPDFPLSRSRSQSSTLISFLTSICLWSPCSRTVTLQPVPSYAPGAQQVAAANPSRGTWKAAGVRRGRSSASCRRRRLRSCSPFLRGSGRAALPCVDRWAPAGPDGGAVGHVNAHLQFGSVPGSGGGGGCSPAVEAAPAVSARLLRTASALCIVISVPASTQLAPGTGLKRTAAPEPAGDIRVAPRAAAWDMRREFQPRHSAGSDPAAPGRTGREQVGDRRPREETPPRATSARRPTRGTGALRCAPY